MAGDVFLDLDRFCSRDNARDGWIDGHGPGGGSEQIINVRGVGKESAAIRDLPSGVAAFEMIAATKWLQRNPQCGSVVGYDFPFRALESGPRNRTEPRFRQILFRHVESSSPHQRRVLL